MTSHKKGGISFVEATVNFVKFIAEGNLGLSDEEQYKERFTICSECEFYNPKGYAGIGKCEKCKCSRFKLDFKKSRCIIGKW